MKTRNINCDFLRIIALLFVISVHSLLYIGFYDTVNDGPTMILLNIARCLFITCVPIFMILSGYLMSKKEFNRKYLQKIIRIISTYFLCSLMCIIAVYFIENQEMLPLKDYFFQILSFKAAPYSWYVNMYLGLFLLIPFLNILWNNLKGQKPKQYLIVILFIIGILPNSINIFNFDSLNWWLEPSSSRLYQQLIPDYWATTTYIILYYFIGCYLKEYKLKLSIKKNIVFLLTFIIIFGLFNYYRNFNALFEWGSYVGYSSIEVVITTILFVNLILNFKINIKSKKILDFIGKISYLTFGAYLLSAIFDRYFYPILQSHTNTLIQRIPYLFLLIPVIFIFSLLLSWIVELMITFGKKIILLLKNKIR